MDHAGAGLDHPVGAVEADVHESRGEGRPVDVPVAWVGVLDQGRRGKGHEGGALQPLVEPVDQRGVGRLVEDRAVAQGPGPELHAPGQTPHDLALSEQPGHLLFDLFGAPVLHAFAVQEIGDLPGREGGPVEHGVRVLYLSPDPVERGARAETPVGHVGVYVDRVYRVVLQDPLVQLDIGEEPPGADHVAQPGASGPVGDELDELLFEVLLCRRADVLALLAPEAAVQVQRGGLLEEVVDPVEAPVLEVELLPEEAEQPVRIAFGGQAHHLALVADRLEAQVLGESRIVGADRREGILSVDGGDRVPLAGAHRERQTVAHGVHGEDEGLVDPLGRVVGRVGVGQVVVHHGHGGLDAEVPELAAYEPPGAENVDPLDRPGCAGDMGVDHVEVEEVAELALGLPELLVPALEQAQQERRRHPGAHCHTTDLFGAYAGRLQHRLDGLQGEGVGILPPVEPLFAHGGQELVFPEQGGPRLVVVGNAQNDVLLLSCFHPSSLAYTTHYVLEISEEPRKPGIKTGYGSIDSWPSLFFHFLGSWVPQRKFFGRVMVNVHCVFTVCSSARIRGGGGV